MLLGVFTNDYFEDEAAQSIWSPPQLAVNRGEPLDQYGTEISGRRAIYKSMGNMTLSRVPSTRVHSRAQPCSSVDAKHNQTDLEPQTGPDPVLPGLNGLLPGGFENVCSDYNAVQSARGAAHMAASPGERLDR